MYLHIALVCVDPVKERLWSHPLHRETTLRTHRAASRQTTSTHKQHMDFLISYQRGMFEFNHCSEISLLEDRLICESGLGDKERG